MLLCVFGIRCGISRLLACERAAKSTRYSLARLTLALLPLRDDYLACGGCVRAVLLLRVRTYVSLRRERERVKKRQERKSEEKKGGKERDMQKWYEQGDWNSQNQIFRFRCCKHKNNLQAPSFSTVRTQVGFSCRVCGIKNWSHSRYTPALIPEQE